MRLLDVAANTNGAVFYIDDAERREARVVQVEITGTATVKIQGRASSDLSWIDIKTYTATGADPITLYPEMRAVSSGMAAATAKAELDARKRIAT